MNPPLLSFYRRGRTPVVFTNHKKHLQSLRHSAQTKLSPLAQSLGPDAASRTCSLFFLICLLSSACSLALDTPTDPKADYTYAQQSWLGRSLGMAKCPVGPRIPLSTGTMANGSALHTMTHIPKRQSGGRSKDSQDVISNVWLPA